MGNYNFGYIFLRDTNIFGAFDKNNLIIFYSLPGCDSFLASELRDIAGYRRITNLSKKIITCHLHISSYRTWYGKQGVGNYHLALRIQ